MKQKILAIDFDGTISKGPYPSIGGLNKGAKHYINKLYSEGYYIIINTCRSDKLLIKAVSFLIEKGVKFHSVNENEPLNVARYKNDSRKIYAHLYIDDKNLQGFPGWKKAYQIVKEKIKL